MDTVNLSAFNNTPFAFYPDVTTWDQVMNLSLGIVRMQMRAAADNVNVLYEWSTANTGAGVGGVIAIVQGQAAGTISFQQNPANGETITIGTRSITFVNTAPGANQVAIGSSLQATLASLLEFLQTSSDAQLIQCSYEGYGQTIGVSFKAAGVAGNNFALATTAAEASVSSATLTGGGTRLQITAPIADIAGFNGSYVYDCRFEGSFVTALMFGGDIVFTEGVTKT